ncbi:MAG: protein-export membrane protein SecF [Gammaproteobacteria bacterium RIFCSPHIGHO2_12_FULL_63_22]|nr:MAG: protein-export membrane protein SecF [Gammaproteobacteria bacterium RIFCSPHIGHO2_12_FULL_63_22]
MRVRVVSLTLAFLIMAVAIGAMAVNGFNYALDFTGGTVAELRFDKRVEAEAVRKHLVDAGFENPIVQTFGTGNDLVVRLKPREGDGDAARSGQAIAEAVQFEGNNVKLLRSESVGPQIGKELAINGMYAAIFVVVGFGAYVWFRFEFKFAVAALITTLHDVVLVVGWFALSGHEFDLTVLAGVLSVMGFSINDTIVVFDRVRENFRTLHKLSPIEVLNRSINQTLSRTIITSFVAFLTILALYLFAGASLRGMAESQMIGIVFGTLSSIFVACPLLHWLGANKQDLMPKLRDDAELDRRP